MRHCEKIVRPFPLRSASVPSVFTINNAKACSSRKGPTNKPSDRYLLPPPASVLAETFRRPQMRSLACPGGFGSSSRKIGKAANLLRRGYKIGIATGIIECGHVHFLADLRYIDAMISRMTLASENGIFFVMARPRESCKG